MEIADFAVIDLDNETITIVGVEVGPSIEFVSLPRMDAQAPIAMIRVNGKFWGNLYATPISSAYMTKEVLAECGMCSVTITMRPGEASGEFITLDISRDRLYDTLVELARVLPPF